MQTSFLGFTDRNHHLNAIRNIYWHLRSLRPWQTAKRRKLYRQIKKQKAVLIADGFDKEALRLWCRQWCACHPEAAAQRFQAYLQKNDILFEKTHNE